MGLKSYRDLEVWQRAVDLVVAVYQLSKVFPPEERFGLVSQIQRATVSIPADIVEGYARMHRGDYLHHLSIAKGSLAELETHLTVSVRLHLIERGMVMEVWGIVQEVGKMLTKLIQSLRNPIPETRNPSTKENNLFVF